MFPSYLPHKNEIVLQSRFNENFDISIKDLGAQSVKNK